MITANLHLVELGNRFGIGAVTGRELLQYAVAHLVVLFFY